MQVPRNQSNKRPKEALKVLEVNRLPLLDNGLLRLKTSKTL